MSSEDQQQPPQTQQLNETAQEQLIADTAPVLRRPPTGLNGTNMAAATANGHAALQRGLEALAETDMDNNMEGMFDEKKPSRSFGVHSISHL